MKNVFDELLQALRTFPEMRMGFILAIGLTIGGITVLATLAALLL